jgi:UDP-glucose 4-epimerase
MSLPHILVVGGAGFIGSYVTKMLGAAGYHPVVFDNLSSGDRRTVSCGSFFQGDLANPQDLEQVFTAYPIQAVLHFAALIDVGESVIDPVKYYHHNVAYTLNLIEAMCQFDVKTFIFSSSAAIFGYPNHIPVSEEHACHPINPYGQSKWMVENILRDCTTAYGMKVCCLRYFNAAGGDPDGEIKNYKQRETNLIPLIIRSLKNSNSPLTIYGNDYPTPDGTCIRDYIHLRDLSSAHLLALEQMLDGGNSVNYNLGNGQGFSVKEVIATAEAITGLKVNVIQGPRRPGDPPILVADASKAKRDLGWRPIYSDLKDIVKHAWEGLTFSHDSSDLFGNIP